MKNKIQVIDFNRFLPCIFNALFRFSVSIKNGKRNTIRFSFFMFIMKELKKLLLKKIKINFMVIFTSMVYTLCKSNFVSSPLRLSPQVTRTPIIGSLENS